MKQGWIFETQNGKFILAVFSETYYLDFEDAIRNKEEFYGYECKKNIPGKTLLGRIIDDDKVSIKDVKMQDGVLITYRLIIQDREVFRRADVKFVFPCINGWIH